MYIRSCLLQADTTATKREHLKLSIELLVLALNYVLILDCIFMHYRLALLFGVILATHSCTTYDLYVQGLQYVVGPLLLRASGPLKRALFQIMNCLHGRRSVNGYFHLLI